MDANILDTPITGNDVAKQMKDALGPTAILRSFEAEKIGIGEGFIANILRLKLDWETNSSSEITLPQTIVVKVPTVESMNKVASSVLGKETKEQAQIKSTMDQFVKNYHNTECNYYDLLGTTESPIAQPKCYGALPVTDDAPGTIILEDLSEKASIGHSLIDGMTYQQILASVTEIARLHAWSLTTKIDWKSKIPRLEDNEKFMRFFLTPALAGYQATRERYPDHFGEIDAEKLANLATYDHYYQLHSEHKAIMDDVLIHGSFHMNNIMFERNTDGSVSDRLVALIDFQAVRSGSPADDLSRLFTYSMSHEIRRQHGKDILRRYYDEVASIAGDKFKASFDQLCRMHDRLFAFGVVAMVSRIPRISMAMVKSQGEQKERDEKEMLDRIKANYQDAAVILGLE